MFYFLQDYKESDALRLEIEELKIELDNIKLTNQSNSKYQIVTSDFFKNYDSQLRSKQWVRENAIPVGSIEFVQAYLQAFYDIDHMNPIEVPQCLRLNHLLLREYSIVKYEQIPRVGNYFVKDVSKLKGWTYSGPMSGLWNTDFGINDIDKEHLFQVSTLLDILSEYRVCVLNNKILGIQFYDGDPTIMPNEVEIKKIKEMVIRWTCNVDCPKAFTMDVAVVKKSNGDRDLAILECHPYCAVGNYGCRGQFLPLLFQLGIKWYIDYNSEIQ